MMIRLKIILCLCFLFNIGQHMYAQTPVKGEKLPDSSGKIQTAKAILQTGTDKSEITENSLAKGGKSDYILTNQAPNRSVSSVAGWDFTSGPDMYYGGENAAQDLGDGNWGMIAGDADGDGYINTTDYVNWYNSAILSESGYKDTDFNLDGYVNTTDYIRWYNNAIQSYESQVP